MLSDDTHGTRCAGQIGAQPNSVCGVGVAFGGRVAGLRILSGTVTDSMEAEALNYQWNLNHIYSNSWGPYDDGCARPPPFLPRLWTVGLAWRLPLRRG